MTDFLRRPKETWACILDYAVVKYVEGNPGAYQQQGLITKDLIETLITQNYNIALKKYLEI